MSIYSFYENAPSQTTVASGDIIPLIDGTTKALKQVLVSAIGNSTASAVQVTAGATTLTVTQALHGNSVIVLANTAPIAITLPQATGTGTMYKFQIAVAATATSSTIKVANATDVMQGIVVALTTSSANVIGYGTSATSDTISLNGTTLGGVVGDIIKIQDVKTGFFAVEMLTSPTGTTATPFSASVS